MIAWMLYAIALAALFGAAALAAEHALRLWRRPVRFVWLAALLAGAGLPVLAVVLGRAGSATVRVAPIVVWGEASGPLQTSADLLGRVSVATVSLDRLVLLLWLVTTLALLAALVWSWLHLRREGREWAERVIDGHRVRVSEEVGPAVTDPVAGTIVLPQWLAAGPVEERRLALAHELEHRRAGDVRLLWLTVVVAAVFPWNVSLWWHVIRLRRAIELDCDRRVLAAGVSHRTYAELLVKVCWRAGPLSLVSPALIEPRSFLRGRIDAMIERTVKFRLLRAAGYGAAAAVFAVAACETPAPPDMDEVVEPVGAVAGSDQVYAEQVVDAPPERIGCPPPEYPSVLKDAGVEGQVLLQLVVERDGTVSASTVEALSSSHPGFEEPARQMVAGCRFSPALVDGEPVRTLVQMPLIFALGGRSSTADRVDSNGVWIQSAGPEQGAGPIYPRGESGGSSGPPLLVVDGVIVGHPAMLTVDTLDIESIEVVRGAEAERRYGARARNGVVLITTKAN
jgi:TonB family protein